MSDDADTAAAAPEGGTTTERHVISTGLFRARALRVRFGDEPAPAPHSPPEPARRPAKVARMLALAHHIQWAIERGDVPDAATVARRLGLTRARISQLLGLCWLAPDVQDEVLRLEAVDGVEPMAERGLREVTHAGCWEEQRAAWRAGAARSYCPCEDQRGVPHPRKSPLTLHQEYVEPNASRV